MLIPSEFFALSLSLSLFVGIHNAELGIHAGRVAFWLSRARREKRRRRRRHDRLGRRGSERDDDDDDDDDDDEGRGGPTEAGGVQRGGRHAVRVHGRLGRDGRGVGGRRSRRTTAS